MERWFVKKEGLVLGPYSVEELRVYVERGKVTALDLVSRDGETDWTSILQVPQLRDVATEAAVPPPRIDTEPSAPARAWYVAQGNQVVGPLDLGALRAALTQGQVKLTDRACEVGASAWSPVVEVDALADLLPPPNGSQGALERPATLELAAPAATTTPTAASVPAPSPARITWKVLGTVVWGMLGVILRGGGGEAWADLEARLGVRGWRRFVVNLVGIATMFGFLFGAIFVAVTIKGLIAPSTTNSRQTTAAAAGVPPPQVLPPRPSTPVETIDSRAQGATAAVVGYLTAEQRLLPREPYWCGPQEMPGRFHNLIDWRIRPDYVRQRRANPASLPEWFRFTVDLRASNALGGVLAGVRSYYVKRFTDGTYRLLAQCEDDDGCEALLRMDGLVYPAGQDAPCAFPRDEAGVPPRGPSAGVSDAGNVTPIRTALPPEGAEALDFRRLAIERAQFNGTMQLCRVAFVDGPTPIDDVDRPLGWALDDTTAKLKVFCAPPPNSGPLLHVAFGAANQAQALNVRAGRTMVVEVTPLNYMNKPILRFVELR